MPVRASVTLPDELAAAVAETAKLRRTSNSEVVRAAVAFAVRPPERMGLEEALDLLDAKARSGNTAAIIKVAERLLAERQRSAQSPETAAGDFSLRAAA